MTKHEKKHEYVSHKQEKNQSTELDLEMIEMVELVDKDLKLPIKNRPKYLNKKIEHSEERNKSIKKN